MSRLGKPTKQPKRNGGRFAPDPNSKASRRRAEKLRREQEGEAPAEHREPAVETVETVGDTAEAPPSTVTVNVPQMDVDAFFSPTTESSESPPTEPEVYEPEQGAPKKKTKREGKLFAEMITNGGADLWSVYTTYRHSWVQNLPDEPQFRDLKEMVAISDAEKQMIARAVGAYIAEADIDMTPGAELAGILVLAFAPRLIALEGALLAMKRGQQ